MYNTEEKTIGNLTVKVGLANDTSHSDPREWDNLGTMICFHSRYDFGDEHDIDVNEFSSWEDQRNKLEKRLDAAVMLPIYLYDHSGQTISTSPFSCPWDSGQLGWIYVSRKKVREEYGVKRISPKLLSKVKEILEGEIKTYDQYIRGEIYEFEVLDENENLLDCCTGFYDEEECMNEAVAMAESKKAA